MANHCYYSMKVTGAQNDLDEFHRLLEGHEEDCIGRVYSADIYDNDFYVSPKHMTCYISGDCAWSVFSAMRDSEDRPTLDSLSKDLNLIIEVYSEETGVGFQEYVRIVFGDVQADRCVDYEEWWVEEYETIEEFNEEHDTNFTEDMVEDGYVKVGGFNYCGEFSNHLNYLPANERKEYDS